MAVKTPGLTHEAQKNVEGFLDRVVDQMARDYGSREAVEAGVAEWALRYAMRAGLLSEPRVIVRRADRRRR